MGQIGHYGPGDLEYLLAHNNTVLLELNDVSYNLTVPKTPGGTGLGRLENRYHKRTGPAEGTWSIGRNQLTNNDNGLLFLDMLSGAGIIITEAIASASTTHTPGQTLVSVLEIDLVTSGTILEENEDYTVNYATGVITFNSALTEDAEIMYLSTDADWMGLNLMLNSTIEDDITNIWTNVGAGVNVSRSATAKYVGTYGLLCDANADTEGMKYTPDISVVPNRVYRLTFWAKSDVADDIAAKWTDAGGTVAMTAVGTSATLSVTWKLHEFTFTPDEATILDIQIVVNDGAAALTYIYLDEIYLRENAPAVNVMRAGRTQGFQFEIWARRVVDGVLAFKLKKCEVYDEAIASGEAYTETVNGQFLEYDILYV